MNQDLHSAESVVRYPNDEARCPCCGLEQLAAYWRPRDWYICRACGWEDDPVQYENPDLRIGPNKISLRQAQVAWRKNPAYGEWIRAKNNDDEGR
jgi:hypothetical protein